MDPNKAPKYIIRKNRVYYCEKCRENTMHKHYTKKKPAIQFASKENYPMVRCMRCKKRTALYWND